MTLTVQLYNTTDDPRRVTKNIGSVIETLTVHTSDDCSMIYPDLLVDYKDTLTTSRLNFNYAIITAPAGFLNRRYFVTPEITDSHRLTLHCSIDPYSSFGLSNVEGFIIRSGSKKGRIQDKELPLKYDAVLVNRYPLPKSPYRWSNCSRENNTKSNIYILRTR